MGVSSWDQKIRSTASKILKEFKWLAYNIQKSFKQI